MLQQEFDKVNDFLDYTSINHFLGSQSFTVNF